MYMDQKNTLVNVALKIHKKINTNSKRDCKCEKKLLEALLCKWYYIIISLIIIIIMMLYSVPLAKSSFLHMYSHKLRGLNPICVGGRKKHYRLIFLYN